MVDKPHGMIVVTGPTGSGKTTTLYSALKRLARPELNVCTIEDPIEMVDPAVQPDVRAAPDRPRLRHRRAHAAAPGPGHHHGRRDPRPRDRRDRGAGRAHRPPGAQHPAHQRRALLASRASWTWASRPTCSRAPCSASWPSAWCAPCARTAASPRASDPARWHGPDRRREHRRRRSVHAPGAATSAGTRATGDAPASTRSW